MTLSRQRRRQRRRRPTLALALALAQAGERASQSSESHRERLMWPTNQQPTNQPTTDRPTLHKRIFIIGSLTQTRSHNNTLLWPGWGPQPLLKLHAPPPAHSLAGAARRPMCLFYTSAPPPPPRCACVLCVCVAHTPRGPRCSQSAKCGGADAEIIGRAPLSLSTDVCVRLTSRRHICGRRRTVTKSLRCVQLAPQPPTLAIAREREFAVAGTNHKL